MSLLHRGLRLLGAQPMEEGKTDDFWLAATESSALYRWMHGRIAAITLGRTVLFIGLENLSNVEVRRHELIHVDQYDRMGTAKFLWLYLRAYVSSRLRGLDHAAAYQGIPAEVEAYRHQDDVHLPADP